MPKRPGSRKPPTVSREVLVVMGDRVRARREGLGMSQEHLANLADLHRTYIGSVERGERNTSLLNLLKIARALGVEPGLFIDHLDSKI